MTPKHGAIPTYFPTHVLALNFANETHEVQRGSGAKMVPEFNLDNRFPHLTQFILPCH